MSSASLQLRRLGGSVDTSEFCVRRGEPGERDRGPHVFGVDGAPRRPEPGRGEFGRVLIRELPLLLPASRSPSVLPFRRAVISPRAEASMLPRRRPLARVLSVSSEFLAERRPSSAISAAEPTSMLPRRRPAAPSVSALREARLSSAPMPLGGAVDGVGGSVMRFAREVLWLGCKRTASL